MSEPLGSGPTPIGVLLMSFGTAATLDDVPAYLASVRGGRPAPDELVTEFKRRFALVGGSPLTRITREQASALETALNSAEPGRFHVAVGMRHAPPFIAEGLAELVSDGVRDIVGMVLSPQYSPIIMGGYARAIDAARPSLPEDVAIRMVEAWHDEPRFIQALAARVRAALERLDPSERSDLPVYFTAHSLPKSVADGEPGYLEQLRVTAAAVAEQVGLTPGQWRFAYQSAGHTPEPWLTPDIKDVLPELHAAGHRVVLVAPVQFLADHLEVLYDIDVAAQDEARAIGMRLVRPESLNTDPTFIGGMAAVVRRAVTVPAAT